MTYTLLALWSIALAATLLIGTQPEQFTYLAPLYAITLIGSSFTYCRHHKKPCER